MRSIEWRYFQRHWVTPNHPIFHILNPFSYPRSGQVSYANLVDRLTIASPMPRITKHPWKGHGHVTWTISILVAPTISGTAEDRVIKYCMPIGYIKSEHITDKSPLIGAWSGSCDPFLLNFAPIISLEIMKLRTSNFVCWLIHKSASALMIYYPRKGCTMCHVTSLNFGK